MDAGPWDRTGDRPVDVEIEEWRAVVGYEYFYEVSNHGRVRSLDKIVSGRNGKPCPRRGRVLKLRYRTDRPIAYATVGLKANGIDKCCPVHILVAEAFLGPRPDGYHCCHGDGNPRNNHLSNLRWDTPAGNTLDMLAHGTHPSYRGRTTTHCPRGHELTPENSYPRSDSISSVRCRTCSLEENKKYHREVRGPRLRKAQACA
jgi:hypothetical protein